MPKLRLDRLLHERGLAETRSKAQALILAGSVFTGEQRLDKAGQMVSENIEVEVRSAALPYVSRGGLKLAHGLDHFNIDPSGLVAIDIGASTGGFTDVLLQRGVSLVYAVDVGHGQLDWSLRSHPDVVVLEKTNARYLTSDQIEKPIDLVVCDASFISLRLVLPAALELVKPSGFLIALIKPQFEVGKNEVGKGGVVRDPDLHDRVCADVSHWLREDRGWCVLGVEPSPITGPKGNREFLIAAKRSSGVTTT
ncbi:MAG: TlyA family RNA methyltransferase [Geminicoccaceae bacterium]